MGVVGRKEHTVAEQCHTPIGRAGISPRTRGGVYVAPELASGRRAKGAYLVGRGDVHDSITDNGCCLEILNVQRINPFHLQVLDIPCVDLVQGAMAIAAQGAVVGRPLAGFGLQDGVHGLGRNRSIHPGSGGILSPTQAAQIGDQIATLLGIRLERRHVRFRLRRDLHILLVGQEMQTPIQGLQFQIVFGAAACKPVQALTVPQLDVYDPPGVLGAESPARARGCRVNAHLGSRIFEHHLQFAGGRFPSNG